MEHALAPALHQDARCFLEVSPYLLWEIRQQIRTGRVGPGSVGEFNRGTYVALVKLLDVRGVPIIPLDRDSLLSMRRVADDRLEYNRQVAPMLGGYATARAIVPVRRDAELHYYLTYLLREKGWRSTILRRATDKDLVVAHPVHIVRLTRDLGVPPERTYYVDTVAGREKIFLGHVLRRPRKGEPYFDELRVSDTGKLGRFNARLSTKRRRKSRLLSARKRRTNEKIRREPTRIA